MCMALLICTSTSSNRPWCCVLFDVKAPADSLGLVRMPDVVLLSGVLVSVLDYARMFYATHHQHACNISVWYNRRL